MTPALLKLKRLQQKGLKVSDMHRILGLGMQDPANQEQVDALSDALATSGEYALFPAQAQALYELGTTGGFLGFIGVGKGKTLVSCLAGTVLGIKTDDVLVMLPPTLVGSFYEEVEKWTPHFDLTVPRVLRYSMLSRPEGIDYLNKLRPKLLILDEAHQISNLTCARGRRLLRYLKDHPDTHLVAMSGTLIHKSVNDVSVFGQYALGERSPLPLTWTRRQSWAALLDQVKGGILPTQDDYEAFAPLTRWYRDQTGELPPEGYGMFSKMQDYCRQAFHHRLKTAPGVVTTTKTSCDAAIYIRCLDKPKPDKAAQKAIDDLEYLWELPDGTQLCEALEMGAARNQLSMGFFYRWVWPGGVVDEEWMEKRKEWNSELRRLMKKGGALYDSPATIIGHVDAGTLHVQHLDAWREVKDRVKPPTEAVWVSDFLFRGLLADVDDSTIIWYSHSAVADKLQALGMEVVRAGVEIPRKAEARAIALSVNSHGEGQNLQAWNKSIVLSPPKKPRRWEQLVGRTHREGQEADEVHVSVFTHTPYNKQAWRSAKDGARAVGIETGQDQKILLATEVK